MNDQFKIEETQRREGKMAGRNRIAGLWNRAAVVGISIATAGALIYSALADIPQPVMTIAPTGTNQFLIVITNGVTNANYEIYRTPVLGDAVNYPFTLHIIGTVGQTNFTINMGDEPSGFILSAIGSDFDGDGIENYRDGNPNDPNIGVLSLTIESPLNGTTLN